MSKVTLAQLGMNSELNPRDTHQGRDFNQPSEQAESRHLWPVVDNEKDYFIERDGVKFAGMHLLIDLWGASHLDDIDVVEDALKRSAEAAGATILHSHLHHFTPNGGVSGVLVLAESHISIHTWPEKGYAALDVFMCGDCDPMNAVPVLKQSFRPDEVLVDEQKRGVVR